jgi:hypothetical protein
MPPPREPLSAGSTRSSWYQSSEASAFLDDYSKDVVALPESGGSGTVPRINRRFQRQKTTWEAIERRSRRTPRPWNPLVDYVADRMYIFGALLPVMSALLEATLLAFLLGTYYTLPPKPGTTTRPPRVAALYSTFPFISCVGSLRLPAYQGMSICVVVLNVTSSSISLYRGRDERIGWQSRRTQFLASVVAAGLGVWVVFAAANPDKHLHLLVTAAKALSVFGIKLTGWLVDHFQRRRYPVLWKAAVVKVLVWWRVIVLSIAFRKTDFCFPENIDLNKTNLVQLPQP